MIPDISSRVVDERRGLLLALAAVVALLVVAGLVRVTSGDDARDDPDSVASAPAEPAATTPPGPPPSSAPPTTPAPAPPPVTGRIFADGQFLVAYYGTAQTGSLGVLGETSPDRAFARLKAAAAPFARPGRPVRLVFELIVTVADPVPGPRGVFSHDIPRAEVERYLAAARRHGVLLLLDLQPGRDTFPAVARRWEWALREPGVGLALDPEWRMGRRERPGRVVGSVDAAEVNRTSAWLAALQAQHGLPQKLFVLHQFRTDMVERIAAVQQRPSLGMVQHVDGFGTPGQKLATYHAVARPAQFVMGFKLFYDEDVRRLGAAQVHAIRPAVRFVSFQ